MDDRKESGLAGPTDAKGMQTREACLSRIDMYNIFQYFSSEPEPNSYPTMPQYSCDATILKIIKIHHCWLKMRCPREFG